MVNIYSENFVPTYQAIAEAGIVTLETTLKNTFCFQ